jgi:hypothetical protein
VPVSVQAELSSTRVVPCGPYPHRLVQPSRLYTRTEYKYVRNDINLNVIKL